MHQYQKRSSSPYLAAKAYQKKIANQQASMDAEERIEAPPEIDRNIMPKHHSMMTSKLMRMQAAQQQAGGEATSNISESLRDRPVEQFEQQKQADKAAPDGGSSNGKHQGKSSATEIDRNIMAKHHSMMMSKLMQM